MIPSYAHGVITPPAIVVKTGPDGSAADRSGLRSRLAGGWAPVAATTVAAICPVDLGSVTSSGVVWPADFTISGTWATSDHRCSRVSPTRRSARSVIVAPWSAVTMMVVSSYEPDAFSASMSSPS